MELEAYETSSVKVLHVPDDTESLMIERGSFYAARGEDGPVIFRCFWLLHFKKNTYINLTYCCKV